MIIYQDKKSVFLDDIANNYFAARLEDAFIKKTGSLPADSRGWANDYTRFAGVLSQAQFSEALQMFLEDRAVRPRKLRARFGDAMGTNLLSLSEIKDFISKPGDRWVVDVERIKEYQARHERKPGLDRG